MVQQTCRNHWCKQPFTVTPDDLAFYEKISPVIGGKKELIPPPTLCPDCRLQRRLAHRNEHCLYRRSCGLSGRSIISLYAPEKDLVIYGQKEWWSDTWDPMTFGRPFDFSRPFLDQFLELRRRVPRMSLQQEHNENSEYTTNVSHLKNCYLLFSSDFDQDCSYGTWVERSRDCTDVLLADACERSYEIVFCKKLFNVRFAYYSSECRDSAFLYDCRGCSDCFLCTGLRGKQYHIANMPYSREDYFAKMAEFPLTSHRNLVACKQRFSAVMESAIRPAMWKRGSVLDSSGNFLADTQNCHDCFEVIDSKDCRRIFAAVGIRDVSDCNHANGELGYENGECFPMPMHSAFNVNSYTGSDLYYCDMCMNNCQNLFGCIGLKHAQYCVLNRQYTKDHYEDLVPRVITLLRKEGLWGEFLPASASPFGYNETEAMDHFPLSREEALRNHWVWREEPAEASESSAMKADAIPDDIRDVDDAICDCVLQCEATGKPYRIISQELKFYRLLGLPLPRRCPDQRRRDRSLFRCSLRLWDRQCAKCGKGIKTTYDPNRQEKVCCEECYLQAVC